MKTQVTRTARHRADGPVSLDDLRAIAEATKDFDGSAEVHIEEELGQRDAVYYYLVVEERK